MRVNVMDTTRTPDTNNKAQPFFKGEGSDEHTVKGTGVWCLQNVPTFPRFAAKILVALLRNAAKAGGEGLYHSAHTHIPLGTSAHV